MENEKRLISYDVLIAHLDSCIEQGKGLFKSVCVAIKCFVQQMPTVDAVEVVNSAGCKWCNGEYHTKIMATAIRYHSSGNMDGYELKVNYCPNCGADMR